MNIQPEAILEDNLVNQLTKLGYERVTIRDEGELVANLKRQLEKHNNVVFTLAEFDKILNHLNKGNVFDRAKILRDKYQITRADGSSLYIEFINQKEWCRNQYQVTQQVTIEGIYKQGNRIKQWLEFPVNSVYKHRRSRPAGAGS